MYCAYLRKSRADRDAELRWEGETLKRHRELITEYADRLNIKIEKFYCEVVSGETIEARPVMQELLADVEGGMWEGVFVNQQYHPQGIAGKCIVWKKEPNRKGNLYNANFELNIFPRIPS